MKILHIALSLSSASGGPPRVIYGLTEAMIKKGNQVSIFSPTENNNNLLVAKGVELKTFKTSFLSIFWKGHSFYFKKMLEKEISRFDIVHIHEIWHYPQFVAYQVARKFKKPFIITPHGTLDPWALNHKGLKKKVFSLLIQKRILNKATAVQALTEAEAEDIKSFSAQSLVKIIANGINIEEFQNISLNNDLFIKYPNLKGKKLILFLGRVHPKKGLDILANGFSKIAQKRNDVRLLIVGPDNNYQKEVEKILERENVLDKVIFTGILDGKEKLNILINSDIFVLSSYSEGFSITVLEAMACGLPVIITKQCNFPEVEKEKAGIIINPNVEELTKAMSNLLDNPVLSQEMGSNGEKLIKEKFSWDRIADKMINLYKSAIEGKINN